jgi:hypothetical protein
MGPPSVVVHTEQSNAFVSDTVRLNTSEPSGASRCRDSTFKPHGHLQFDPLFGRTMQPVVAAATNRDLRAEDGDGGFAATCPTA